ncbi:hypothetical protein NON00_24125, partial [Roseomonas sp. GC11]|uniref:hypothetical protein n=1 Tax=Roseomonas sp. GC11 TaxID=2950546 RepID=UPI00210BE052
MAVKPVFSLWPGPPPAGQPPDEPPLAGQSMEGQPMAGRSGPRQPAEAMPRWATAPRRRDASR